MKAGVLEHLAHLGDRKVAVKVTLRTVDGFSGDLISHPNIARVVVLSEGYGRDQADALLAGNPALILSQT